MSALTKIPTNIITGVLGSGKTTAIQSLIDQKPSDERWAIVINEYGQVSIDNALLDSAGDVEIMELANGCVCCSLSYAFVPLLAQLIRRVKPHRLIVEPSGAGHPARIIDLLRGESFANVLDLGPTICMVDPADAVNPRVNGTSLFLDQLQMAELVAISWLDKRSPSQIDACRTLIHNLDPPKQHVYEISHGQLEIGWLKLTVLQRMPLNFDPQHSMETELPTLTSDTTASIALRTQVSHPQTVEDKSNKSVPRRFQNQGHGIWACGWIFHPDCVFDRDQLLDYLDSIQPILRMKGIFHCEQSWWAINRKADGESLVESAYRSDSRLEIITNQPTDWQKIEEGLISCLQDGGAV